MVEGNGSESHDMRLKTPFTAVEAGPTGCGKSELVASFIKHADILFTEPPVEIYFCSGTPITGFENDSRVKVNNTLIDVENDIPNDGQSRLLIVNDLQEEVSGRCDITNIFVKYSHHKNLSVVFIVQNLFHKKIRPVTLNAHYLFVFKNPRDASQIHHLGRQLYPSNPGFLVDSYGDATKKPYSYLTIDLKQNTDDSIRVLGNFFTREGFGEPITAYTPK